MTVGIAKVETDLERVLHGRRKELRERSTSADTMKWASTIPDSGPVNPAIWHLQWGLYPAHVCAPS